MIILYSTNSCVKCLQLKKYLKNNNIVYEEKNIEEDFKAMAKLAEKGFTSVPVVDINGEFITGDLNNILDRIRG